MWLESSFISKRMGEKSVENCGESSSHLVFQNLLLDSKGLEPEDQPELNSFYNFQFIT